MSPLSLRLVRAAFAFLALGITLGVIFGLSRSQGPVWRPLHAEFNLWGWVTLLIYGMAYHVFPRFAGRPLASPLMAEAQGWLAIAGVALAAGGWTAAVMTWPYAQTLLIAGGLVEMAAVLLFARLIGPLIQVERVVG